MVMRMPLRRSQSNLPGSVSDLTAHSAYRPDLAVLNKGVTFHPKRVKFRCSVFAFEPQGMPATAK
ncbi:hypothetical protein DIPPA_18851 [Diplonema papillatum]|nr:hypothetical protein DIPPA_18851 [Diplonema papillatum]